MWKCPNCQREFERQGQVHTCRTKKLEEHFKNKALAKEIFDCLFKKINAEVGRCKIISIACCIHLYGEYDFLAALPRKDHLEIRFSLERKLESSRFKQAVLVTRYSYKNCIDLKACDEIDPELISWISEAYFLKTK